MSEILLSFCIPTRNRARFIGETLDSLIAEADESVEIVVVDGGSTDDTEAVVAARASLFERLRYCKSSHDYSLAVTSDHWSAGFERDCNRAVDLARGGYCWLFPDDDVLKPGALARVLEAVRQQFCLVVMNSEVRTQNLAKVLEPRRVRVEADRVYRPPEQDRLLRDIAHYISYMGGVVIRREIWLARRSAALRGTAFPHAAVIFDAPLPGEAVVIADPGIEIRYGNAQWYPRSFEIWMILWPRLIWSMPYATDQTKNGVVPREPWRAPKRLVRLRALGGYSRQDFETWIRPSKISRLRRLVAWATAVMPQRIANLIALAYYLLFRRRSKLEFEDLITSPHWVFGLGHARVSEVAMCEHAVKSEEG